MPARARSGAARGSAVPDTFGHRLLGTATATDFIAAEREAGRGGRFAQVDGLIAAALQHSLAGERLATISRERGGGAIQLLGLSPYQRTLLEEQYALQKQEARGAWFLPEEASLKVGLLNVPHYFRVQPRFAGGLILEERGPARLRETPDAVFAWSVLEPLCERLFVPVDLRGRQAGEKTREEQLKAWADVNTFYAELELQLEGELAVMRYGGGWSALAAQEQVEAKQRLLTVLARQVEHDPVGVAARCRVIALRPLLERYYVRAKTGPPLRRRVVSNQALAAPVAGFFAGDWLALLEYLEEVPHPDERVATSLPETRLFIGGAPRATEVAAQHNLPVEEVERMLAAFWTAPSAPDAAQTDGEASDPVSTSAPVPAAAIRPTPPADPSAPSAPTALSPVEERIAVLERYWDAFDAIHARQTPKMRPLWGLVEEKGIIDLDGRGDPQEPHQRGIYRDLLPADLCSTVDRLWRTTLLQRWPDRVVTEPFPHALMADAFGPALRFWHGCALTAWFICEGPSSRTDMAGLAQYHERSLTALEALGCPIDPAVFKAMIAGEKALGPAKAIEHDRSTDDVAGVQITITFSSGARRKGFERLRDTITERRRQWAKEHLQNYLRARWEAELREAARHYSRLFEERGKPPTAKRFAPHAEEAAGHWFAGDLSGVYGAIGERSPVEPSRTALMAGDANCFARTAFALLGGKPFDSKAPLPRADDPKVRAARERDSMVRKLADLSLRYVQLHEAIGTPPTLTEFGRSQFEWTAPALAKDVDQAWQEYGRVIEKARLQCAAGLDAAAVTTSVDQDALGVAVGSVRTRVPSLASQKTRQTASPLPRGTQSGSPINPTRAEPELARDLAPDRPWWKRIFGS